MAAARRLTFRQATKSRIQGFLIAVNKSATRFKAVLTVNATVYRHATHHVSFILSTRLGELDDSAELGRPSISRVHTVGTTRW